MNNMINPIYLETETVKQLKDHYNSDPDFKSVSLTNFFTQNFITKILDEIDIIEFERDYREMTHRRQIADPPSIINQILSDPQFLQLSEEITGENLDFSSTSLYKFGHTEYQIINDETVLPPGFDIIIDLTPEWVEELGGIVTYTDGEGQFYAIPSNLGSVTIVKRSENIIHFVKYVNHYAENLERVIVISNSILER